MTVLTAAVVPVLDAAGVKVGVAGQPARDGTKPFVVIWADTGVRSALTMQANDGITETWMCHCLGLTPDSAAVAARKLADAVYGLHRQVLGGRIVHWPEQLTAVPVSRDDTVDPPLFDSVVEWRFTTSPA